MSRSSSLQETPTNSKRGVARDRREQHREDERLEAGGFGRALLPAHRSRTLLHAVEEPAHVVDVLERS